MDKDGSYKHYSLDCEYHFVTAAAYENIIIGKINYRLPGKGICITNTGSSSSLPDFIRIDLDTGEAILYDTSMRNGCIYDTFTVKVTLNEN